MNKKKVIIISVIIILILGCGTLGYSKYKSNVNYNNLVASAKAYMDAGQYDKAESIFKECLSQRDDKEVKENLNKIKKYKEGKKIYDQAVSLMKSKEYDKAIEEFKKIPSSIKKLYDNAQNKIKECEKLKKQDEDKKKKEEAKRKEEENKRQKEIVNRKKSVKEEEKGFTENKAMNIITGIFKSEDDTLKNKGANIFYEVVEKGETERGVFYKIRRGERKDSHIATWGWYTVSQDGSIVDGITGEKLN